jgi:ABC-2 type transport system ATP-binding protein
MAEIAIKIEKLSKTYLSSTGKAEKLALDNLDLSIRKGSITALLGPNGAGKSTLINILAGISIKTSGSVKVMGYDLDSQASEIKRCIGIVPQEIFLDTFFPVYQALEFFAGYYGIRKNERRTEELLKVLGLWDKKDVMPHKLSGGMKRRFLIAKAMVHSPEIIILDEPTAGVDLELREALWNYVRELNAQGITIILTTHYLEEAQVMCDEIAFINNGQIIKHAKKDELFAEFGQKCLEVEFEKDIDEQFLARALSHSMQMAPKKLIFNIDATNPDYNHILQEIAKTGVAIKNLRVIEPDLTEIFHKIIK